MPHLSWQIKMSHIYLYLVFIEVKRFFFITNSTYSYNYFLSDNYIIVNTCLIGIFRSWYWEEKSKQRKLRNKKKIAWIKISDMKLINLVFKKKNICSHNWGLSELSEVADTFLNSASPTEFVGLFVSSTAYRLTLKCHCYSSLALWETIKNTPLNPIYTLSAWLCL